MAVPLVDDTARRQGEDEDAYTFVDRATFEAAIEAGRFLEHASVLGELYGTPMPDAPPGRDIVLEIDVQGARQVRERCTDVVCVLLVPPSPADEAKRMENAGTPRRTSRRVSRSPNGRSRPAGSSPTRPSSTTTSTRPPTNSPVY